MKIDFAGTALVIGAIAAGIPACVTAYLQIKAARKADAQNVKLDAVAVSVDGHATEQTRQITALHTEVARLQAPGTTTPATGSDAPVTMDMAGVKVTGPETKP